MRYATVAVMVAYLMLSGRATASKAPSLFDLAAQMLTATQLDNRDRVRQMLKASISRADKSRSAKPTWTPSG